MKNLLSYTAFKKSAIVGLFLLLANFVSAQRHEIGVQGGLTSMVGDVGRTGYILHKPFRDISTYGLPAYSGLIYRMNFNPYQTLRFDLGSANVQFSDAYAKEAYRNLRNINSPNIKYFQGTNTIYNADVQFEYNFFPVNNEQKGMLSPYVFGGVGAIFYTNRRAIIHIDEPNLNITAFEKFKTDIEGYTDFKLSVPFGAGLKYKFNYNWALFGEIKFRYTMTDNIDYSKLPGKNVKMVKMNKGAKASDLTPEQVNYRDDFIKSEQFGNINSKDWVNAITLGLSYSFGRPPCYCD